MGQSRAGERRRPNRPSATRQRRQLPLSHRPSARKGIAWLLLLGSVAIERPAVPPQDLLALHANGRQVYVDADDIEERGIDRNRLPEQFKLVRKPEVGKLMESYDQIWQW